MAALAENFMLLVNELRGSSPGAAMSVFYLAASYLIGALSPSIIIGRLHGIDIRGHGSGNAGTTNVLRTLGKKAAVATLALDVLKGFAPVLLAKLLVSPGFALACGLAATCGHIWPAFHGFKGGKGVATGLGVVLAFDFGIGGGALLVALAGMLISKRVSFGALLGAVAFPVIVGLASPVYLAPATLFGLIVWVKHSQNIKRLMKGQEPKISFSRRSG